LGPHSDSHPLYCDWIDRNNTLVTHQFFQQDLQTNLNDLSSKYGVPLQKMKYWIPPYEWYNWDVSNWSNDMSKVLFDFTPGTLSNTDYAPENDTNFVPSEKVYQSIVDCETTKCANGMNGFLFLIHLGSTPDRHDKFTPYIPKVFDFLVQRNYTFVTVDVLLQ